MYVKVYNNDMNKALRILKKKMQDEGLYREMRDRRFFEKKSDEKRRLHQQAVRRERKKLQSRTEHEGY